jgi:hypothetical protein
MTKCTFAGIAAALLLGTSSIALAQTQDAQTQDARAQDVQAQDAQAQDAQVPARPGVEEAQRAIIQAYTVDEITRQLGAAGFEDIQLERDGPHYVGTGWRQGQQVDLRVLAATGRVLEPSRLSAEEVRQRLEDLGFTEIGEMEDLDGRFRTTAQRFGEEVELLLSARTGGIIDVRDMTMDGIVAMLEEADYENIVVFERDADYGNFYVMAEIDEEPYLLVIHPVTGRILSERGAN